MNDFERLLEPRQTPAGVINKGIITGEMAYQPKKLDSLIRVMEECSRSAEPSRWLAALTFATGYLREMNQQENQ
jgi:hypothetical protein